MNKLRLPCPDCDDKASVQLFKDGSFCHACRKQSKHKTIIRHETIKTPKKLQDLSFEIPELGMKYLRKYRLTDEDIDRFRIGWSEEFQRLVFPYLSNRNYYEYYWLRDPTGLKQPKWLYHRNTNGKDMPYIFKHSRSLPREWTNEDFLIITEDVISAIRCYEFGDVLALGSLNWNKESITDLLLDYKKLILWLDGDKPGREAAYRFYKKWSLLREVKLIKTKQDPKCFNARQIEEILNEV